MRSAFRCPHAGCSAKAMLIPFWLLEWRAGLHEVPLDVQAPQQGRAGLFSAAWVCHKHSFCEEGVLPTVIKEDERTCLIPALHQMDWPSPVTR